MTGEAREQQPLSGPDWRFPRRTVITMLMLKSCVGGDLPVR